LQEVSSVASLPAEAAYSVETASKAVSAQAASPPVDLERVQ